MKTPFEAYVMALNAALRSPSTTYCTDCGGPLIYVHDHRPDNRGLDDGPYLPGNAPRKKLDPKSSEENRRIHRDAWNTRRKKYGPRGHR